MQKKMKQFIIFVLAAAFLTGFAVLIVRNYKTKTSFKYAAKNAEDIKPQQNSQDLVSAAVNSNAAALVQTPESRDLLKISPDDFVLGDKNAAVVVFEYASLSCPHCASFVRESFEKLKSEYIDTGKIQFVFRNFPLNQQALIASMIASCQAYDNRSQLQQKYYATLKALFKTQDSWAFDQKYMATLETIAKLDGMSSERFNACVNDKNLQEKILIARMNAVKKLQIKSAPSFFVNGEISEGYIDYQTIKKLIDKKLAEIKNNPMPKIRE
jgi:protein-disulfide isomerase